MYSLRLERVEEPLPTILPPPRKEVSICYNNIVSGYANTHHGRSSAAEAIQEMIGSEYKVSPSNYYMSVIIRKKNAS